MRKVNDFYTYKIRGTYIYVCICIHMCHLYVNIVLIKITYVSWKVAPKMATCLRFVSVFWIHFIFSSRVRPSICLFFSDGFFSHVAQHRFVITLLNILIISTGKYYILCTNFRGRVIEKSGRRAFYVCVSFTFSFRFCIILN